MTNTSAVFGAACAAALWVTAGFSEEFSAFPYGTNMPVPELVALLCASAVLYLLGIKTAKTENGAQKTALVFTIGLLMRAGGFFAHPVLENDYFRYLWDGAVAAEGINPYLFSPSEAIEGRAGIALETVAMQSGTVAGRINHPFLTTIYPPLAQVFFALSHLISEWSVNAWRAVLLGADVCTFFILTKTRAGRANPAIYWWNPLLVFTVFFSCHLEALIFPFAAGAVWAAERRRGLLSVSLLSLSVAVKIWTAALIGAVLKTLSAGARKTAAFLLLFGVCSTAMVFPLLASALVENSGLAAYSQTWENNSSFFRINLFLSQGAAELLTFHPGHGQLAARVVTALIIAGGAAYAAFSNKWRDDAAGGCLFVTALVFFVIPTQFPWYYCWLLPFLAMRKQGAKWSLIAATAFLPLYYLKYHFSPDSALQQLIVWAQFLPIWTMVAFEHARSKR